MQTELIALVVIGSLAACTDDEPPKRIATNPTALAAVGEDLAWRTDVGGIRMYSIELGATSGIGPATRSTVCDGGITANRSTAFWTDCRSEVAFASSDFAFDFQYGTTNVATNGAFAVDEAYIYSGIDILYAHPRSGGTGTPLTTARLAIDSVAIDQSDGALYVGAGMDLLDPSLVGGIYRVSDGTRIVDDAMSTFDTLAAGEGILAWSTPFDTYRASSDGSGIVRIGGPARRGLQITSKRIWWVTTDNEVVSTSLDGSDARVHYHGDSTLVGPAVIGDRAYVLQDEGEYADWGQDHVPYTHRLVVIDL
jgi:hypothetical protein